MWLWPRLLAHRHERWLQATVAPAGKTKNEASAMTVHETDELPWTLAGCAAICRVVAIACCKVSRTAEEKPETQTAVWLPATARYTNAARALTATSWVVWKSRHSLET
eukprot:5525360-Amphidinium_carterae.1